MYPEPTLSESIAANEAYRALVGRATRELWEALGGSDDQVDVAWELVPDHAGRDEFRLILRDAGGGVAVALFTPDDLARPYRLRSKFYQVWGRLLGERTRHLLREFNEMIAGAAP